MKKKITKILLLSTLLVLLVGVACASEVSNDTDNTIDNTNSLVQETQPVTKTIESNVVEKEVNNKEIINEEKNIKTASKTYDVNDFNTLHSALTSDTYDTVTVNIKSNITLTNDTILNETISKLTINGNGKTIDGQNNYQFLKINNSSVTLKNLKIINCKADYGGAICNEGGNLTIYNSTFNNNTAGTEWNCGGGAISNYYGNLSIYNSTFNNNTAEGDYIIQGGAIYNHYGNLSIYNSKFYNNTVNEEFWRGTLGVTMMGGAIYNDVGNLSIHNSKFYNNIVDNGVGGAIFNIMGDLTINNSVFNNNIAGGLGEYGGAIFNDEGVTLTIYNSTFNNNAAENGGAIHNFWDRTITLTIYNSTFNNNTANHGGAIDGGNFTIHNSIFSNNTAVNGGAIINNGYGTSIIYNSSFNNNKVADYHGGAIDNGGTLTIHNSRFYNNIGENGGAIHNDGILNILNSTLINNNASNGGAIHNEYGNLTIYNSTFNNNTATQDGGAICGSYDGDLSITKSIFNYNKANSNGGAILSSGNTTSIINNTFKQNNATTSGGAIYSSVNNTIIEKNIFINNTAKSGSALYLNTTPKEEKVRRMVRDEGEIVPGWEDVYYNANDLLAGDSVGITSDTIRNYNLGVSMVGSLVDIGITGIPEYYTNTIVNKQGYSKINNNTFKQNKAQETGKAIINKGTNTIIKNNIDDEISKYSSTIYISENETNDTITNNIFDDGINYTKLALKVSNTTPIINTLMTITVTLTDTKNKKLSNQNIVLNINGKTYTVKTNTNGIATQNYTPTASGTQTITATYKGNSQYNNSIATTKITVKINTKTTVSSAKGIIGEKLTIKATVTDANNKKVNEGNLIFKINGITIKDNGKLTGSTNPLKVKVTNGVATATITPDLSMRNIDILTASYIGTSIYNASTSSIAKMQVSQRNASIVVTSNVKKIKQGQVLTLTAKVYDTTNGKKSTNLTKYNDEFVYFKVNGITLKDKNGNMLKVKIVNGTATTKYTIPLGLSGVTDGKTMTPKNHTILAGFYNKNYREDIRNKSTFQVERSNITITIANATVNNKTHKLSLTATIKDYLGNIVAGPNKCVIKINGMSLKNGTQPMYYYSNNGILNIKDINIPAYNNYKSIEIVTQDRLAYKSQRNTTSTIKVVK